MNIQTKLIVFMATMLLLLFIVTVSIGTYVINTIIYRLNTELLALKLTDRIEKIDSLITILEESGATGIVGYVSQAQTEILQQFQHLSTVPGEQYYILRGQDRQPLFLSGLGSEMTISAEVFTALRSVKSGTATYRHEGVTYFTVYRYVDAWDWVVGLSLPQTIMFRQRQVYFTAVGSFSLLVFIGVFLLAYLIGKRIIVTPLALLVNTTKAIATGRFDHPLQVHQRDEIGQLAEAIHRMAQQLRQNFEQITAQLVTIQRDMAERLRIEEALRQNEKFLHNVVENIPNMIFVKDANELRFVRFNKAGETLIGYSRDELLGKNDYDFFPKQEADFFANTDRAVLAQKILRDIPEESIHTREHGERILHTKKIPILDKAGNPAYLLGISEDITERKRMEEALEKRIVALTQPLETAEGIEFEALFNLAEIQHLQDLYAAAFGVAALITRPDGTPITRPSNFTRLCGDIIRKTPKGAENCHYSDAMIGRYNPTGPSIQLCLSAGLCNAGASISVGGHHIANWLIGQVRNETQDEEKIMHYAREIGADEAAFRAAYRKVPIMSQEQFERVAQLMFVLANQLSTSAYQNVQQARFIAERKQAEEALRASEERFRNIFSQSPIGIELYDKEGHLIDANPVCLEMFGIKNLGIVKGFQLFEDPNLSPDAKRRLRNGESVRYEMVFDFEVVKHQNLYETTKSGQYFLECFITEWGIDPDNIQGFVVHVIDITARKQAEEEIRTLNAELEQRVRERTLALETVNKELESFAYVVSHDLKAPLRAISRLTTWLVEDYAPAFDEKGKNMAELLIGRVKRMDNLIEGILEYSRIGRIEAGRAPINLNELVAEVINTLAPPTHIHVRVTNALPTVVAGKIRLFEVFQNLIGNAIKFMEKPQGEITVNCSDDGAFWRFTITDNGAGIEPKYHDRIFRIFQTLHPRDEFESTGIGLAVVKKIVEFYGGQVGVESIMGQGSTFWFTLPKSHQATA